MSGIRLLRSTVAIHYVYCGEQDERTYGTAPTSGQKILQWCKMTIFAWSEDFFQTNYT